MNDRSRMLSRIALSITLLFTTNAIWAFSLDDFIPPSQGGTTDPTGVVNENRDVITAANMQDGLGFAYKQILDEGGDGVRTVTTKTGTAMIAASTASYKRYENINATMLSKRGAYVKAFSDAQKRMVQYMNGFQNNCTTAVSTNIMVLDTGNESNANTSSSIAENCAEVAKGVLSAYITYQVEDNDADNLITVSLASSTMTRSAVNRVGGAVVLSADPKRAFEHIAKEISLGVVPPLGAKLIHNPENGEAIVIGFGSSIIRHNKDVTMQRSMRDMASRQSQVRANSALVSFLNGSAVYWEGGFDEQQVEASQQFDVPQDANGEIQNPIAFENTKNVFLNTVNQSDDYEIVTGGRLPPGVKTKTFPSEDGYWMNTIAIYMSSATSEAEQAGRENMSAGRKLDNKTPSTHPTPSRAVRIEGGVAEGSANPKGPSGRAVRGNDF